MRFPMVISLLVLVALALIQVPDAQAQISPDGEQAFIKMVARVRSQVVAVTSVSAGEDGGHSKYRFSGVLISPDGTIVTVADAIRGMASIEVLLLDGKTHPAKVVGLDKLTNVGVLKIDAAGLPHVTKTSSESIPVGSMAVAVGNPFGLHHSVTTGIISGRNRSVRSREYILENMIQTTAPINPGDAGGFLGDSRGRFVGMITSTFGRAPSFRKMYSMIGKWSRQFTANPEFLRRFVGLMFRPDLSEEERNEFKNMIDEMMKDFRKSFSKEGRGRRGFHGRRSRSGQGGMEASFGAQGINFVMPAHKVLALAAEIRKNGRVIRGTIGASGRSLSQLPEETRKALGLSQEDQGVVIDRVLENGPAHRAGMAKMDVLVSFNDHPIPGINELRRFVFSKRPGQSVSLVLLRKGEKVELTLTVEERK